MTISKLPVVRGILRRLKIFTATWKLYIPPGHYYSPIVSQKEVAGNKDRIFRKFPGINGIDLNEDSQNRYLNLFKDYYADFSKEYTAPLASKIYNPRNGFYSYTDGIFLYSIMRYFKPQKVIEVGSGFSSSLMYDVSNTYFDNKINLTFIEPYPEDRLFRIFSGERPNVKVVKSEVQSVEPSLFLELRENDILFIDSSHVSKTGSDLNFLLFEILPNLNKGVLIHFHDIFYPFEYPEEHVLGDRWFSWNEAYALHAFLIYNSKFEIVFWNSFLEHGNGRMLKEQFPLYAEGGSASIWIRKM